MPLPRRDAVQVRRNRPNPLSRIDYCVKICGLALPFVGLLAGCAAEHKTIETQVEIPAAFSITGSKSLPVRWWDSFEDPDLDALIGQ